MGLDQNRYRLSEAENQAIFENRIIPVLNASAKPSDRPCAVLLGGQPGAGKSAVADAAMQEMQQRGGAVKISGDEWRGHHPKNASLLAQDDKVAAFYTGPDAGRWVEKAIEHAKINRYNIVIEGTMRDDNVVAKTMKSLREAGYEIDARALAVKREFSEQGILQRYETQKAIWGHGRMTTQDAHNNAYAGMLATLERIENEKLADRIAVCRRSGETIYTNELQGGEWVRNPQARKIVEAERGRPMIPQERRDFAAGYDKLAEMLARGERNASPEEIRRAEDLRQRARRGLAVTEDHKAPRTPDAAYRGVSVKSEAAEYQKQRDELIRQEIKWSVDADVKIAKQMLSQGFDQAKTKDAIRMHSPEAKRLPSNERAAYACKAVNQAAKSPDVQKAVQSLSHGRGR